MKKRIELLDMRKGFFRIHKGYPINMKCVEQYSRIQVQVKNNRQHASRTIYCHEHKKAFFANFLLS